MSLSLTLTLLVALCLVTSVLKLFKQSSSDCRRVKSSAALLVVYSVYSDIFAVSIQVGSIHEKRQKWCIVHVVYILFIYIHVAK